MSDIQYVSKKTFDELWNEYQAYKAANPRTLSVVNFDQIREVGILHDRIRELEERVAELEAAIVTGGAIVPDAKPEDSPR